MGQGGSRRTFRRGRRIGAIHHYSFGNSSLRRWMVPPRRCANLLPTVLRQPRLGCSHCVPRTRVSVRACAKAHQQDPLRCRAMPAKPSKCAPTRGTIPSVQEWTGMSPSVCFSASPELGGEKCFPTSVKRDTLLICAPVDPTSSDVAEGVMEPLRCMLALSTTLPAIQEAPTPTSHVVDLPNSLCSLLSFWDPIWQLCDITTSGSRWISREACNNADGGADAIERAEWLDARHQSALNTKVTNEYLRS